MKIKNFFKKILKILSTIFRFKNNQEKKKKSHKDEIYPLW